jgi:type I restriction enzyme S subunit
MAEVAPLVRRPVQVEPDQVYQEIGVRSFGKGVFHKPPSRSLVIGDKKVFAIEPGDLLFNIVFAWEGAVAVAGEEERGTIGSHRFLTCVTNSQLALAPYLYWYFIHERGLKQLQLASPGGAGRNRTLGTDKLAAMVIELPSIEEQQRVVDKLDGTAKKIARLRLAARATQAELRTTLNSAFRKATFRAPRIAIGDIAPIVRRPVELESNGVYAELGVRSFGKGLFKKPDLIGGELTWQKLFRIHCGDIVFSNIKAWEGAFAVAKPVHHGKVGSHRYLTSVVDTKRTTPNFLWYFLQSDEGLAQVQAASPGSADRNRTLNQKKLAAIEVPLPSLDAQLWFDKIQQKASDVLAGQVEVAAELEHLIPALLQQAFD